MVRPDAPPEAIPCLPVDNVGRMAQREVEEMNVHWSTRMLLSIS